MRLELNRWHDWDVSTKDAIRIQGELVSEIRELPLPGPPQRIAGVDVSFHRTGYKEYTAFCGIAVVRFPELDVVERTQWTGEITFPYVPGLLSFREIPAVLQALEQLDAMPDVIMADGQGRAHPRRFGLACHLGLLLDMPVLGVAKSLLVGEHDELPDERGSRVPLIHKGDVVGAVVRTRRGVKPVYVSVGHRITLDEAVDLALACTPKYRIPEPTRQAHTVSRVRSNE